MAKEKTIAEFGDFQTPPGLARQVCDLLAQRGLVPASLLEPTCGLGALLFAGLDRFQVQKALGADVNATYIKWAQADLNRRGDCKRATLTVANFFVTDWEAVIKELPEPALVLGNPPWVTNAHLASLGSQNLPAKSNFQNHQGFDAITGKANFDISESMLLRLIEAMNGRRATLAMLCKSSVARKTLCHAWKKQMTVESAAVYGIEASSYFDAAVDAALLVIDFKPSGNQREAAVFPSLKAVKPQSIIGYENETLVADLTSYRQWRHLAGRDETLKWRSGIKHDCSKVMELRRQGDQYRNGLGELADLEDNYLYPMLKSSDLANGRGSEDCRWLIVTQKTVGEPTAQIADKAPLTWRYLTAHAELLRKRVSSIYQDRPDFSIFGVGDYSFAPWKVAISGFYKKLAFVAVGSVDGKPIVLDDTSYFLACETKDQAEYLTTLLNSPAAQGFYRAFVFWDAKRPITAELLRRLDLRSLAVESRSQETFAGFFGSSPAPRKGRKRKRAATGPRLWAD